VLNDPALIVVAHPDDESLGLGSLLPHFQTLRAIIHITDGAPRRGHDAANAGAEGWHEYAVMRRCELNNAMNAVAVPHTNLLCLRYADQETAFHLSRLPVQLAKLFLRFRPATVFTHPYEGGHPDHDSCAMAVHCARLLLRRRAQVPRIFEFASYHAGPHGAFEAECFLNSAQKTWPRTLSSEERAHKSKILSNFVSQRPVLSQFPLNCEPVRIVPHYDFSKPPHAGKLYYENFDWGMTGARWRRLARRALITLNLVTNNDRC
jgi:LmbE family N-acetylglucosaminyl deacetylase